MVAAVRTNKCRGDMRNDFKACVDNIVPYCLVSKKGTPGTKKGAAEILEVNTDEEEAEIASFG